MDYPFEQLGPERFQQFCHHEGKFAVFQVKFARRALAENEAHKWLLGVIKGEAPKVRELIPKGATRYYLLTNVPGTAHPETGSIDTLNTLLTESLGIPSFCWWRDDLSRRLDSAWAIKWAYPELLSGPDILRVILESGITESRERRTAAIRAFLMHQYKLDEGPLQAG